MILTGKAEEDFEKWLKENYNQVLHGTNIDTTYFYDMILLGNIKNIESVINALIIDFFDSVNINIHIDITSSYYLYKIYVESLDYPDYEEKFYHGTNEGRKIAQTEAIKKANEIYNQNY